MNHLSPVNLHSLAWLFIPQLLLLTLEYEPNPMPRPYEDDFWHRNFSELFLTDYRCKIFIVFSVLTLSPTNAPLALWPTTDSPDSNRLPVLDVFEEVFIIIGLCLLQVALMTGFGLPSFSFCI